MSKLDAYLDTVLGVADQPAQAATSAAPAGIDYDRLAAAMASQAPSRLPPASNAGVPMATSAGQIDLSDVTQWTPDEYERQFELKAPVPHNRYDIRNRVFHREIRRMAEARMAKTKIMIGGRKG